MEEFSSPEFQCKRYFMDDSPSKLINDSPSPNFIVCCSPGSDGYPDVTWKNDVDPTDSKEVNYLRKHKSFSPKYNIKNKFKVKNSDKKATKVKKLTGFYKFQKEIDELFGKNFTKTSNDQSQNNKKNLNDICDDKQEKNNVKNEENYGNAVENTTNQFLNKKKMLIGKIQMQFSKSMLNRSKYIQLLPTKI